MVQHTCVRCGYTTSRCDYMGQHLRRKLPCKPLSPAHNFDMEEVRDKWFNRKKDGFTCKHCDKVFVCRMAKFRHQRNCTPPDPVLITVDKSEYDQLMKGVEDVGNLRRELEEIRAAMNNGVVNTINNTTNNNTTNNIVNNTINILDFGKENVSTLSPEFLMNCLAHCQHPHTLPEGGVNGITMLLSEIHSIPENKNVRILNRNQNLLEKRMNDKWVAADKNIVLEDMVSKGYQIIQSFKRNVDTTEDTPIEGIIEDIEEYMSEVFECKKDVRAPIKRDVFIMLVNQKENEIMVLERNRASESVDDA